MRRALLWMSVASAALVLLWSPEVWAQADSAMNMLQTGGIKVELTPGAESSGNLLPALKLGLMLMLLTLLKLLVNMMHTAYCQYIQVVLLMVKLIFLKSHSTRKIGYEYYSTNRRRVLPVIPR